MAGNQVTGDELPASLAGMSKNQLYYIMSQMKTLIEQNKEQAKQILIQNPALTKALFQAQIMLGMVQSPQAVPTISQSASQTSQPSAIPKQQSNIQAPVQNQMRKQPAYQNPETKPIPSPNPPLPQSTPSHPLQPIQQSTPMAIPQSSQVPNLPLHSPSMPSMSTQPQQPLQNSGGHYMPPLQPPLPPQARPQMPTFPHQMHHAQTGPNLGFQHSSGPQMHHSQHMFHSGAKPPAGLGPSYPQGQPPIQNQPLPGPPIYQGGGSHLGMEYNQGGSSKQTDRGGSNWMPGPPENTQLPGPPPFPNQMPPTNQPPRQQPPLTPDLEKALLQQVMSLTPEQINMLPTEQRNQILQLQQMLRQ